ncbi:MAG: hypothetical protein ABIH38_03480 [Patescibacteria group bacterium]
MGRKLISIIATVIVSVLVGSGIVYAASVRNITTTLGGVAGDYFNLDGILTVSTLKVGSQGVGGVTFFNGSIVNNTTTAGLDNPVTFGDNVRIDGRIYRGATAGPGDTMPFIVNDDMEIKGNLTLSTGKTLDLSGVTVSGLDNFADLGQAETITANWVNTQNPWSSAEIADITRRVALPLASFYSDADGTPAAITTTTVPNLAYTANQGLSLVYSATETTDIGTQFTVPSDYVSGGIFKVLVDTSAILVADLNLDFKVAISQTTDTTAWDTDMDDEDPVDITGTAGTPKIVTLTPTDQTDISAGDTIFLDLFPDTYGAAEPDLEIYAVWFEYTAVQ